jgi:hypothetical protein
MRGSFQIAFVTELNRKGSASVMLARFSNAGDRSEACEIAISCCFLIAVILRHL